MVAMQRWIFLSSLALAHRPGSSFSALSASSDSLPALARLASTRSPPKGFFMRASASEQPSDSPRWARRALAAYLSSVPRRTEAD